jgi:hypothetical protein
MFKKKDIIVILLLGFLLTVAVVAFISSRQQFKVGGVNAIIDNDSGIIFISLPEGSPAAQKVYFNFPFKNDSVYIKRMSAGSIEYDDSEEIKLVNGNTYDFEDYISHSKISIKSGKSTIEYDLWITTGNVPIITIETEKEIPDEPKIDCTINILSTRKSYNKSRIASEIELVDIVESDPKNSYSLNIKENRITRDVPQILGFDISKRFRLSALDSDRLLSGQKLAYDIFKSLDRENIAPESEYVELYLNNQYRGVYLISRRVDRNMFGLSNYNSEDHRHSVIYEASNWRADYLNGTDGFSQIEPDYENDGSYFSPLEELIDLVSGADSREFLENAESIINIDNLMDNHILFLLSGSSNKLASNQYVYRGNSTGDKFCFCPGNYYDFSFGKDKNADPEDFFYPTMLFNRLYEDKLYREKLKEQWENLRKDILSYKNLSSLIDKHASGLSDAAGRDFCKWASTGEEDSAKNNFNEKISHIKNYINDRLKYFDSYINDPPLISIGGSFAKINDQTDTIFCTLPEGSDTSQTISWHLSQDTEIYIERLPVSSSPLCQYLNQIQIRDDFNNHRELINKGSGTDDITIFIDKPSNNELVSGNLHIAGWSLKEEPAQAAEIEHIFLFDGPIVSSDTFLGKASSGLPREDVASKFNNPSYRNSGFEIYLYTPALENGLHELHLYVFDKYGDYSIKKINIEVKNDEDLIREIRNNKENLKKKLVNGMEYNFVEYIFHGNLIIKDSIIEKEYDLYVTTSDVPVAIIYTDNQTIPDDYKIDTLLQIMYHDPEINSLIDSTVFDFYGKIGIEKRGHTSLNFPKNQYSVEVIDENGEDKNVSLLGMPPESDWVLGAPYSDKTLIRNVLAYKISNEMGMYAPRTKFVEVFFDISGGYKSEVDYAGLYVLTEKIKRDAERVEVEKMDSDIYKTLSGGYILEMSTDDKIKPVDSFIETERGLKLINIYPRGESITMEQKMWITGYINEFERALYSYNFKDPEEGYRKYIDVDSLVDYIIINELFKNVEAFSASTILYKERYEKLKMGPVWDFNLSTGNTTDMPASSVNEPVNWVHTEGIWRERLFEDEYFVKKYIERWGELRKDVLSDENILDIIESNVDLISEAQIRNFNRWDILGKYVWPNPKPYAVTYEEEIEKLKNWLIARAEWIDSNIDSLGHEMTCYSISLGDDGCFEFKFRWLYDHNNLVKIYDMDGNEVFSIDMPNAEPGFKACLPDGNYTVKTFHDESKLPIQEFIIRKP